MENDTQKDDRNLTAEIIAHPAQARKSDPLLEELNVVKHAWKKLVAGKPH